MNPEELRQKPAKGQHFRIGRIGPIDEVPHSASNSPGGIFTYCLYQAAPRGDVASDDDVFNCRLRQITTGGFGEVPVLHQRLLKRAGPRLENEVELGGDAGDLFVPELVQFSGFEGREGRPSHVRRRGELSEGESLLAPSLRDQPAYRHEIHESSISDHSRSVQHMRLPPPLGRYVDSADPAFWSLRFHFARPFDVLPATMIDPRPVCLRGGASVLSAPPTRLDFDIDLALEGGDIYQAMDVAEGSEFPVDLVELRLLPPRMRERILAAGVVLVRQLRAYGNLSLDSNAALHFGNSNSILHVPPMLSCGSPDRD